jgi:mannosyltransferase
LGKPKLWTSAVVKLPLGLILVLLIQSWGIATPSLWADEIATISAASRPLSALWVLLQKIDMVHGTYYLFMHFWGQAFGLSPFWLRLPSALAITATSAVIWLIAKKVSGERLAWWALAIATFMPRLSWAATEGRSYAFSALVGALICVFFIDAFVISNSGQSKLWIAYGVALGLGINLFVYTILLAITQGLWFKLNRQAIPKQWWWGLGTGLGIGLFVTVWAGIEHGQVAWLPKVSIRTMSEILVGQNFLGTEMLALLATGLILALALGARRQQATSLENQMIGLWSLSAVLPPAVVICYSLMVSPIYDSRYFTFATPLVVLLLAMALDKLMPRFAGWVSLAVIVALSLMPYFDFRGPQGKPTNWAQVAQVVAQKTQPGDAILFADFAERSPSVSRISIGYPGAFNGLKDITRKTNKRSLAGLYPERSPLIQVLGKLSGSKRVWLLSNSQKDSLQVSEVRGILARVGLMQIQRITIGSEELFEFAH